MKKISTPVFVIFFLLFSCNILENEQSEVSAEISEESLSVYNGTNKTIWFAAFKTEILPFINYALNSGEGNEIKKGKKRLYSKDENLFGNFEKGETVTVFYWSVLDPKEYDISTFEVKVK